MKLKFYATLLFCFSILFGIAQPPSYVPSSGLISWWGLSDLTDASLNGNTLTNSNATLTTDRFNNSNAAFSFNGTDSYLTIPSFSQVFTQSGSFSVSIWLKKGTSAANVAFMSGSNTTTYFIWNVQSNTTNAMFGTNKQGSAWFWTNATTNFVINEWEHYVGVYTSNTMTFYRNGVLQGTTNNTHTNVNQANLPIWIGRGVGGNYFNGSIDDIGIWNRVLNPNEIANLYQSNLGITNNTKTKINIYPNPSGDFFTFDVEADLVGKQYQIFDELGRIISANTIISTTNQISTLDWSKGIYFIKIDNLNSEKIIIN
jgi:hypothetical protein